MTATIAVRELDAESAAELRSRLGEILIDCVHAGASVGFLAPLEPAAAESYWRGVERAVAEGRCKLLVATVDGVVVGTVQLDVGTLPNQRHRATLSKLLVHTSARRRGVGEALTAEAERAALDAGRWLLTLDTATGAAARLYERRGWTAAGAVPDYAQNPDGTLTETVFYWKRLA